jgi:hypothetical protein
LDVITVLSQKENKTAVNAVANLIWLSARPTIPPTFNAPSLN